MLLTSSSLDLVGSFVEGLSSEFSIKDLGPVHHFLGVEIQSHFDSLHLSQSHYTHTILEHSHILHCQPMSTTPEACSTIEKDSTHVSDPSHFRGIVGTLQYLNLTHPDLFYNVNYVSQFMNSPTMAHLKIVRQILRNLKETTHFGLYLHSNTSLDLSAFSDTDWAGCPTTRHSTTGYCTFLRSNIISSCAKK